MAGVDQQIDPLQVRPPTQVLPAEVQAVVAATQKAIAKRPAAFPKVLATSSEKGDGLPELRAEIARVCLG